MLASLKSGAEILVAIKDNPSALVAVVAIAAFVLVGFALYVVLKLARGR